MSNRKKKLLVVGGTGVISFAVVNEAIRQGISVTCINRGISKTQSLPETVETIVADYRNAQVVESKLNGRFFDAVIDVLCYSEKDIEYSVSLFHNKCKQYIFFSSCAVYNKGNGDYECTEESELINPVWDYSINKVKCEKKLKELCEKYDLTYTIVRPAVTYGNTRIPYGVSPPYGYHGTLIHRILSQKPIILWDDGNAYSTITHVDDFAFGLVGLLGNPKAYNQVYHIVGDERIQWKKVVELMGEVLGVKPITLSVSKERLAEEIPSRKGEILGGRGISQLLDNSKIKNTVNGFGTRISLKDGLARTIEYYRQHNYLKGIDYKFDGDWDRIVKKICCEKKLNPSLYNIAFVDYLGSATKLDKINYFRSYYRDNFLVKIIEKTLLFFAFLKRVIRFALKNRGH